MKQPREKIASGRGTQRKKPKHSVARKCFEPPPSTLRGKNFNQISNYLSAPVKSFLAAKCNAMLSFARLCVGSTSTARRYQLSDSSSAQCTGLNGLSHSHVSFFIQSIHPIISSSTLSPLKLLYLIGSSIHGKFRKE
jgi:hypothetical protein